MCGLRLDQQRVDPGQVALLLPQAVLIVAVKIPAQHTLQEAIAFPGVTRSYVGQGRAGAECFETLPAIEFFGSRQSGHIA